MKTISIDEIPFLVSDETYQKLVKLRKDQDQDAEAHDWFICNLDSIKDLHTPAENPRMIMDMFFTDTFGK